MKLKKICLVIASIACASVLSSTANADENLYFEYFSNDDGAGHAGLVYESVQTCQKTTGQGCIMPDFSCNGYKFATMESSYRLMKELATGPNGDFRISVGKNFEVLKKKYEDAKASNFEIKLCQPDSPVEPKAATGKNTTDDDGVYLYYTYANSGDSEGGVSALAYESVQKCEEITGKTCKMPRAVCNGYRFATTDGYYYLMEGYARGPNGDWRVSVGKSIGDVDKQYQDAKASNFEIKLCQSD